MEGKFISILTAAVTFFITVSLTYRFSRPTSRFYLLDYPNERSLHTRPTPRTGGVAILIGILLGGSILIFFSRNCVSHVVWLGVVALLVGIVSFIDDLTRLPPLHRLMTHLIASALLLYAGFELGPIDLPGVTWVAPSTVSTLIAFLFIIWMVNLYNFMDGINGFAGGMAVFGFGTFALLGGMAGHELFSALNVIVVSAAAGFLVFNFPSARIFLGDTGSSTLGLLAAVFSLWGSMDGIFPLWIAILVFSPFIVDATATLVRRILRREEIWQPHKTHYYQRLVQLGWGHRRTVLWEYVIMSACSLSALWTVSQSVTTQWLVIAGWAFAYAGLAWFVSQLERAAGNSDL